jgi:hypothetical protein
MDSIESHDTFYLTNAGYIIPTVSGSISCISSAIIIFIIMMSRQNTVYHRVLFVMSFCDLFTSSAIALTTLPMPTDVIYPFQGPSYGNATTCEAQGLVYALGSSISVLMNATLHIYYLSVLRFKVPDHIFSKKIEPVLLLLGISLPVIFTITLAVKRALINPSPYASWCSIASYPFHCNDPSYPDETCIRGEGGAKLVLIMLDATISLALVTLIISMTLIICFFWGIERGFRNRSNRRGSGELPSTLNTDSNDKSQDLAVSQHNLTKTITIQALMYFGAFLLTWIWPLLSYWKSPTSDGTVKYIIGDIPLVQILKVIFHPLQGFFNLLIFVYHKIWSLRRSSDINVFEALKCILFSPRDVPVERIRSLTNVKAYDVKCKMNIIQRHLESQEEQEPADGLNSKESVRRSSFVDSDLSFEPSRASSFGAWTGGQSMLSGFKSALKNEEDS